MRTSARRAVDARAEVGRELVCRRRSAGSRRRMVRVLAPARPRIPARSPAHLSRLLSARSPSISATATYALSQATYACPPGSSHSHFRCSTPSRVLSRTKSASLPEAPDCDHSSMAENPRTIVPWIADRYVRALSARPSHHSGGFVGLQSSVRLSAITPHAPAASSRRKLPSKARTCCVGSLRIDRL
jgi:hypothetical protein